MYYKIEKKSVEIHINIYAEIKADLCRIEEIHKDEIHNSIKYTRIFNTWFVMYYRYVIVIIVSYISVFIISMHEIP